MAGTRGRSVGMALAVVVAVAVSGGCGGGLENDWASGIEHDDEADGSIEGTDGGPVDGEVDDRDDPPTPSAEVCNGFDDDLDGAVDDGCACSPGASQACYPGDPDDLVAGAACAQGVQACTGSAEFSSWGACEGAVLPGVELCGDGVDDDCDGAVDEGCLCSPGEFTECYTGPEGTLGVGLCAAGNVECTAEGVPSIECVGEVLPGVETCNGVDDDCNGLVDESGDCAPCIEPTGSMTNWQINYGEGVVYYGFTSPRYGDPVEYDYSYVPPEGDGGWADHGAADISFADPSTLCGVCECLQGGDFTYFQTFVDVAPGYAVTSLVLSIASVDDGARVTIFNDAHPEGVVDPGSYVYLGGGGTTDLAGYVVEGRNRIVLTHLDDCCADRILAGATITMNGGALTTCE